MVEVFKTNVSDPYHAKMLVDQIHMTFMGYTANFDLQDCDRILRVQSQHEYVEALRLIKLLEDSGFEAKVLSDDKPVNEILQF